MAKQETVTQIIDRLRKKQKKEQEKKDKELKAEQKKELKEQEDKAIKEAKDKDSDDKDKSKDNTPIIDKPKSNLLGASFMFLGDALSGLGRLGGLNNEHAVNPLNPFAGIAYELGVQHAVNNTSSGLGKQTADLVEAVGAEDSPGWAKLQLLQRLMQNRDAAFQRRLQYGIGR